MTARPPDEDMTIWIATRPDTRKVAQIRNNAQVTLYFNDDEKLSYVTVMGSAKLHDDLATLQAKNWYPEERLRMFWPDFPKTFYWLEHPSFFGVSWITRRKLSDTRTRSPFC